MKQVAQPGVVALDDSNFIVPNYTGTVTVTSSNSADTLPGPITVDHGFGRFQMTPGVAGADTFALENATGTYGTASIDPTTGVVTFFPTTGAAGAQSITGVDLVSSDATPVKVLYQNFTTPIAIPVGNTYSFAIGALTGQLG